MAAETFNGTNYPDYWVSLKGPLEMNFVAGINAGYAGFELDYVCKKDQSKYVLVNSNYTL